MSSKNTIISFIVIVGLALATTSHAMDDPIVLNSAAGKVSFPHVVHGGTSCQQCHHPVEGQASRTSCNNCHNKKAPVTLQSKNVFHKLCIGCHTAQKKARIRTGPAKLCSQCHKPN